jgi:hypothetical protein
MAAGLLAAVVDGEDDEETDELDEELDDEPIEEGELFECFLLARFTPPFLFPPFL